VLYHAGDPPPPASELPLLLNDRAGRLERPGPVGRRPTRTPPWSPGRGSGGQRSCSQFQRLAFQRVMAGIIIPGRSPIDPQPVSCPFAFWCRGAVESCRRGTVW
jgi:hypothetical protein